MRAPCLLLTLPTANIDRWLLFLFFGSLLILWFPQSAFAQDQYEAENSNRANVTVATQYAGYTGSGYVTNLTNEWSFVSFGKSSSATQTVRLDIRYANGTGSNVTNLALYLSSDYLQDLVFPPTQSWNDWQTLSVTFKLPAGYYEIKLDSKSNVATSVNVDAFTLTTGVSSPPPGSFSQSAPASGATGVSTTPAFSWSAAANASSYNLVVSTSSSYANPAITQTGLTGTSYTATSSLLGSTKYYWKVTATNSGGSSVAANAGLSFTTATPPPTPPPGSFAQTAPAGGTTGASTTPTFSWATASGASNYALVVSTSSNYTSPVVSQSGISGTSYSVSTALSNSTKYYWKVTASNANGSTVASNGGISFTTAATAPPPPPTIPPTSSQPGVIREFYANIPGTAVSDLTSSANFPGSPTSTSVLTEFNAPNDVEENYGQRVRGYLKPTASGSYQFSIAADDDAELWLSTDSSPANKVKIASVNGWTNYLQYNKYGSQTSASITLSAGTYYYIEALQKEASGGDHLTVAWQGPGTSHQIIGSANLVTAPPAPPGSFTLTAPASNATGISLTPTFSWNASSNVASYTLVVSTQSSYANPVINQSGLSATSFTPGGGLSGTTKYYWKVTAVNAAGSVVASNAGRSFTTLTPPAPGVFTQTAPASNATGVSRTPTFTWAGSTNASSYSLVVSTSSAYTSPVINQSGLTTTSFTPTSSLSANQKYYWKVTAVNSTGAKVATNAGNAFTTSDITGTYYYVATTGQDAAGRGSQGAPFRTIAYAAKHVPAGPDVTIYLNPGTYSETKAIELPLGVSLEGAGESSVTITSPGNIPIPAGVDRTSNDWKLWYYGSLIQLYSAGYSGGPEQIYGAPNEMVASSDGNQTLSGFTVDGNNKQVKAGVWVQNRNNVTMHHVTIKNCEQRGAVFTRSDMWWYEPLPEGKWMHNTKVYNCTFKDNGAQLGSETLGNLCLAGLDGANIYNLTINDNVGYGIKFIMVGHFRNVKIHDCDITVNEEDAQWGEKISIELWNLDQGNEIYNIKSNTWHSYVNHGQLTSYEPSGTSTNNLKIHDVEIIDPDGVSSKEAIEAALSGVEIYDCYIQDKGFGIAIWNGQGQTLKKNYIIRDNIFVNVNRAPVFGFGKSSAVFVPDAAQNLKIYNNVFDRMGNGLNLDGVLSAEVKNNVFLNSEGADVENGSGVTFQNNLKYHTNPQKNAWNLTGGVTLGSGNIVSNPGFRNSGSRPDNFYRPASSASAVVDAGINVGFPFNGSAPDIGRWELGSNARTASADPEKRLIEDNNNGLIRYYPNPSAGLVTLEAGELQLTDVRVYNRQGQLLHPAIIRTNATWQIDFSAYPNDLYFLRINHAQGQMTKKVMLAR
jgi:hypothetical protein